MTLNQLRKASEDMDVPLPYAVSRRVEYLESSIASIDAQVLDLCREIRLGNYDDTSRELMRLWVEDHRNDVAKLRKEINFTRSLLRPQNDDDRITPEQVQAAREYPLSSLIEFVHKTAVCPFHSDSKPSLHSYANQNRCWCFVCHKGWNPIDFVMQRDEVSFKEAVLRLQ
jgi:hypothetical protein